MPHDIETERTTTAQAQTNLVANRPDDGDFTGQFVFAVGVDEVNNSPHSALTAFSAEGFKEGTGVMGFGGGTAGVGVSGKGGIGGTGVSGKGGPGGKGVEATGGDAREGKPGYGVEAVGGLSDRTKGPVTPLDPGNNRNPNAPGVVATSGSIVATSGGSFGPFGSSQPITLADTGNVGVFGQGGDRVDEMKNDTPPNEQRRPDFTVGPDFAGAGVIGRGGVFMKNSEANAAVVLVTDADGHAVDGSAGIVGIAGGLTIPQPNMYSNTGVFGQSTTGHGVSGLSTSGVGVNGVSTTNAGVSGVNLSSTPIPKGVFGAFAAGVFGFASDNPGGLFVSDHAAQLRLSPQSLDGTPTIAGLAGDLLATIDLEKNARLWFCTKDSPQNWVLIGGPP
jgi:hypothetical protein